MRCEEILCNKYLGRYNLEDPVCLEFMEDLDEYHQKRLLNFRNVINSFKKKIILINK